MCTETYDILLINGLQIPEMSTRQSWGFHPTSEWWRSTFDGGYPYFLDWENELLINVTSLLYNTAVQFGGKSEDRNKRSRRPSFHTL